MRFWGKRNAGRRLTRWSIGGVMLAAAMVAPISAAAKTSSSWTLYSYNSAGTNLNGSPASPLTGGLATFTFPSKNWSALLLSSGPARDLTGQSLSATVGVSVTSGSVFQYMCASVNCNSEATVRLFVSTQPYSPFKVTSSNQSDFWWSHASATTLASLESGTSTISDSLATPGDWSDANGHFASDPAYMPAFNAAVQHIQFVGLSFGGGNFFDNGVRIEAGTGSGSFDLTGFTSGS